jgi:phosphoheptose isomerase
MDREQPVPTEVLDPTALSRVVEATLREAQRTWALLDVGGVVRAAEVVRGALITGKKVLLCGNGGSAADAQHIAAELVGRFVAERRPLPAIALTTDTSALTAIANDYGYEHVFARQIEAIGTEGDVLVAITTSGSSKNVIAAREAARRRGMKIVGLTGARGTVFAEACDAAVVAPSTITARIQECHITVGHIICEVVDRYFTASLLSEPLACKQMSIDDLVAWRHERRRRGQVVAWTNGVFDLLHVGHLRSLRAARSFGDVLVVGVNDDASTRSLKGSTRPIYPVEDRVELLAGLDVVDAIFVFGEATPERALSTIKPDVHVKGSDYADKPMPERAIVEAYGGRVELVPIVPGRSTTAALDRIGK